VLTVPDSSISIAGTDTPDVDSSLTARFLTAIDIEGFSQRSAAQQAKLHDDLEHAMSKASANVGLDRGSWDRQPRGDGELSVLPDGSDGLCLVADYPRSLVSVLAEINRPADRWSRLRVRMAIHHGPVHPARFGPVGEGPITVCRLLDAQVLRQMLRQRSDLDIVLIVSAAAYDEIIQSRFRGLDPRMLHRTSIKIKGNCYVGYRYVARSS
jgi:class 3 adenylate cyclase